MTTQIELGGVLLDVLKKDIKNVHLSVHPPTGRVRIAAPLHMKTDTIRVFAIAKLGWIRQQQRKIQAQERETPREFVERESHYVWGRRYLLSVREMNAAPSVELNRRLILQVRPGTSGAKKQDVMEEWYRQQLRLAAAPMITKWQVRMGVTLARFHVQRMRTKWGSCSPRAGSIRLNTELAKKPPECLEYIVVHELLHLVEATHNDRFVRLMDRFMPKWQFYRDKLNRLPVRHEAWTY